MSEQTIPETLTNTKRPDDVHGHRWTVTGVHGRVTYRELGGAVQIVSDCGDRDHAGGRWPVRAAAAAETGDDQAVYAVLAQVYEANWGGAAPEPSNPDRICRHCAGTGMDSTRHLDVVEDHPCGYCAGSGGAR